MGIYEDIRKIRVCIDQLGQITLGNINIDATSFIERTASASGPGYAAGNQIVISLSSTGAPDSAYNLNTGQAIAVPVFDNLVNEDSTPAFTERVAAAPGANYVVGDRIILILDETGNTAAAYNSTRNVVLSPVPPEDDLSYPTGVIYTPVSLSGLQLELPKPGDGSVAIAAVDNTPTGLYRPAESGSEAFLLSSTPADDNGIPVEVTWGIVQFQAPPSALTAGNSRYLRDLVGFSLDGSNVDFSTSTGVSAFTLSHLGYLVLSRAQLLLLKATSNADGEDGALASVSLYTGSAPPFQMVHGPLMDDNGSVVADEITTTFEVYDIIGSLNGITATPYGGSGVNGVPGDSVTILPPWRHIEWEFTRAAAPDPGDGSVSVFAVNGLGYLPGAGTAYGSEGGSFGVNDLQNTTQSVDFVAYGGAAVQIKVVR